jgi:hypothetical protein
MPATSKQVLTKLRKRSKAKGAQRQSKPPHDRQNCAQLNKHRSRFY